MEQPRSGRILYITTAVKYVFSLVLIFLTYFSVSSKKIVAAGILELLIIAMLTDLLLPKKEKLIRWINNIVMLLFNAELLVMYFGGSFVSLVMLTNIPSLHGLSGRMPLYAAGALAVIIISFLPVRKILKDRPAPSDVLIVCLILELGFTMIFGSASSTVFSWYRLGMEAKDYRDMRSDVSEQDNVTDHFYQNAVRSFTPKPEELAEKPNVVVIMTEGLSQRIVDDGRGITPNIAAFQKEALTFTNYYNHTFATYRGIIGQLYSGYQLDNLDTNTLVSLQSVLSGEGYQTCFVNTEPNNIDFTDYLASMGFDRIVSDQERAGGASNTASDREAYEILFDTILEQEAQEEPFFTVIYTYGTHVTLDSGDEVFGDGSSAFLNKFYNMDCQFGAFLERFLDSPLAEDTVLVFTADHATYGEEEYAETFPGEVRASTSCDRMPLSIYYQGMEPSVIDAGGRNSVDFAPTILDYLDITAPNYFLGTSLFSLTQNDNTFDKVYYDGSTLLTTENNIVGPADGKQQEIVLPLLSEYFAAKTQTPEAR